MSVKVGLGTLSGQVPVDGTRTPADVYDDILSLARTADQVGFDSLWVSSHHGAPNAHLPAPLVMLAAAAAVTQKLQLGAAVVLAPFQDPLRFAEDCAVLDQISRGRLIVGLGAGWREEEFAAFGIPMTQRVGRTAELARICRFAWNQERFSFPGKYSSYEDVTITPKPFGRLPLVMGGMAPAAVARAGRLADGFIGSPANRLDEFRKSVAIFDEAAREAGKDPTELFIGFHTIGWVSRDGKMAPTVQQTIWNQLGNSLVWHSGGAGQSSAEYPPLDEAKIRERTISGTPAEVVAQLRPWVEAFPRRDLHVLLRMHCPGLSLAEADEAVRLFAAEVIPSLKEISARLDLTVTSAS